MRLKMPGKVQHCKHMVYITGTGKVSEEAGQCGASGPGEPPASETTAEGAKFDLAGDAEPQGKGTPPPTAGNMRPQKADQLQCDANLSCALCLAQLRAQRDGEIRRREIRETMHSLKSEVRAVLHTGIEELEMPTSDASDSGSHKENYPQVASLRKTALTAKVCVLLTH